MIFNKKKVKNNLFVIFQLYVCFGRFGFEASRK